MAENVTEREDSDGCESSADDNKEMMSPLRDALECAVCLQTCVHPVQLSCGHIFCYLCVKGVANQSKRCAMCRQEISSDFLDHPQLIRKEDLSNPTAFDDGQQWFYEGRNGWWQYDERTSLELESAFKRGDRSCELLIAGFLYLIDFDNMVQLRRNDPSRKRRIKRDAVTIAKKGVAGLRFRPVIGDIENRETADGEERHLSLTNTISGANGATALAVHVARSLDMATLPSERVKSSSPTLIPPNNTPQTPHTPSANSGRSSPDISDHSINRAMLQIETLTLDDDDDDDDDDRDSFHEVYSSEEEN